MRRGRRMRQVGGKGIRRNWGSSYCDCCGCEIGEEDMEAQVEGSIFMIFCGSCHAEAEWYDDHADYEAEDFEMSDYFITPDQEGEDYEQD